MAQISDALDTGSLRDFCERVEDINFGIRFPGGDDEYFQHLGKIGHHMSRSFVQAIYGDPAEGKN
ncbi:hypothetical protein [Cupriavidus sp. H19C3]|uniref:hypothetical protein n=1 Tax=Cupriavidus sp. H19C3 TaxID=3241603 RepID=UPI003BF8B6C9